MVNSVTQAFSYSAIRLHVAVATTTATPAATSAEAPADTVSISPDAAAAGTAPAEAGAPAAGTPAAAPSRAERRAEALFGALDADDDGTITEQEFTEGALQLLRNAGARRRLREDDDHGRHEGRGVRRLERRLEKLFDRVDANDDGAIDKSELTDALSRIGARKSAAPAPAGGEDPRASGTFVAVSVTYVSIAVQRYSAVQSAATTAPPTDAASTPETRDAQAA